MSDKSNEVSGAPDAGEIEWAGTIVKKAPQAEGAETADDAETDEPEEADLDAAERLGDHHYPG